MEQIIFTFTSIVNFALAVLAWYQYNRRKKLQKRLDVSEYERAMLIGDRQSAWDRIVQLEAELADCKRLRDEKGRFVKK